MTGQEIGKIGGRGGEMKMKKESLFYQSLCKLAIPIALQSLIMALLNLTDQIMVGQLGDAAIASVGIASKIFGIISVVLAALATSISIYVAQYWGKQDTKSISQLLGLGLTIGITLSLLFSIFVHTLPDWIMALFTTDQQLIDSGYIFLKIVALSYIPTMLTMLYSAVLRSTGHVKFPMYVSLCAVIINILLNYVLIFGKLGLPQFGLAGAGYATVISRVIECLLIIGAVYYNRLPGGVLVKELFHVRKPLASKFLVTMYPIILTEIVWVLGEMVYAIIYSRMGTVEMTAMTITFPLQGLAIGLLSGLAGAASVMVGNQLGAGQYQIARNYAIKIVKLGLIISIIFGIIIALLAPLYTRFFQVSEVANQLSIYVMWLFAAFLWVKVANMIIAGGVLQSGGDSKFVFYMESTATWMIGVPLGLLLSFVLKQPLFLVYLFLSLEEIVRFIVGYYRFRSGKWLRNLTSESR